ncbi:GLE1-like protein-domain-containing protein [Lipomyces kononenkoae]|uniref:GLE1-like protein-domain-containing protein n=1 Tax=Lipomyces kononenkoae TaxID=34357 RepID=A0ACC3T1K8_LIPKO
MGVYSLVVDPPVDEEPMDAESVVESISTPVKIGQENLPTTHRQEQDVLYEDFAQKAISFQPLDASHLEFILSRSPFTRARLTSTERVKENMALVYSMISKWSAAQEQYMQESLLLENEYVKQQRDINWKLYQTQKHDEDSYWTSKSKNMWGNISEAIQNERKTLEEVKRMELARKRELERQRLEQEKLEQERKDREEKDRQAREEQQRKDQEEREQKEREDHERRALEEEERRDKARRELEEKARREQEEKARRELEEKERTRLETERRENEERQKRELEAAELAKAQEAKQREDEARQRALDAIQKRIHTQKIDEERKSIQEAKAKDSVTPDDEAKNLSGPEPKMVQEPPPSVTESKVLARTSASLDDTDLSSRMVPEVVRRDEVASEPEVPQYIEEARAEQDYYHKLILYIKSDILAPVEADKGLKTYCSTNKRKIKPKLGQLTNSRQQIRKILGELNGIIDEAKERSDLCYKWLLNFLSKSIVSQAETETIVSPMSAFPLGTLAVFMMSKHDMLRDLLIARIVKKCPYVIGFSCSINTEEGRIRMGYKRIEGKWEDDAMYCERMGGIAAVWGVMTQIGFPLNSNIAHPYPIYHSWTFISRMLNLPPECLTNAHFTVMASWWELTARRFLVAFGLAGRKLLTTVWDTWTRAASDKRYPAAARLRILGEQWQEHGETGLVRPEEP